ncbi:MAG: DUF504 domain-containing protein [Desulfurococcales archaeon]|nr:DUF504 domain-containing protein [Desulfurococcales archaeon]MCE4612529.1 DUF504 domain-containing protein [Desulfurococcales archaeon]
MARKRSRIRDLVRWLLYKGARSYKIVYVDRSSEGSGYLRQTSIGRIAAIDSWAMHLDDGDTTIPFHRVVEIRDDKDNVVWSRWQKEKQ